MTKFLKNNNISKVIVIAVAVIFTLGVLQIYSSKSDSVGDIPSELTDKTLKSAQIGEKDTLIQTNSISSEDSVKVIQIPKEEIDISNMKLSSDLESLIKTSDKKSADKNLSNFKRLLKGLNVSDENLAEIRRLLKDGHKVTDIMIAYEYLYESYGLISELEGLLKEKETEKKWVQVFEKYSIDQQAFVPTTFEPGYLEELMKDENITADIIMNADRISQKGLDKFDNVIKAKKQGKTWKEISDALGLVNTSDKLPRVAISKVEVDKLKKDMSITENQVVDGLVLARKLGEDETEIMKKVKTGSKKEEILAKFYEEKYK